MSIIDTTPPGTQAQILRQVANHKHPKLILGPLAGNHHMTLDELQVILHRHGYPEPSRMLAAAAALERPAQPAGDDPVDSSGTQVDTELGQLVEVPVNLVHPDPDNPRDRLTDIEDLAQSMLESGLLQPVIARRHDGKLILVAGHRRLAAAKHLKWTTIPCIVRRDMRPDAVLAAMLIENGQRADLDPIEEARGLNRLKVQLDASDLELAKKVGRSQPFVSSRLALLALPPEKQQEIRDGLLSVGTGTQLGRLASGKNRPGAKGKKSGAHLDQHHPLAPRAGNACRGHHHPKNTPGRIAGACGKCWEEVIRADERQRLNDASATLGRCVLCDTVHDPDSNPLAQDAS